MAHSYYHAQSAAHRWGGTWQDYIAIEQWFDQTKSHLADCRHRLILHNTFGVHLCQQVFGTRLKRPSDGNEVGVHDIAVQHIQEDFGGRVPTVAECLAHTPLALWMERSLPSPAHIIVRRFGGQIADYQAIVQWFDVPLRYCDDPRRHLLLNHSLGVFLCEQALGPVTRRQSDMKVIPTRLLAEVSITHRFRGKIPSIPEVLRETAIAPWMCSGARPLSRVYGDEALS